MSTAVLRVFLLVIAGVWFSITLVAAILSPAAWPMAIVAGLFLAAIIFERARYGAAQHPPLGPGWHATAERFIDDTSGRAMTVWVNPATGERRYVDDGDNPLVDTANKSQR